VHRTEKTVAAVTMGFIIHKYFLSKSLKAPPPSDSKKKKGKAGRRYSQAGVDDSFSEHLTIPEHAYADSASSAVLPSTPSRRRRSSLSNGVPSHRRASMPTMSGASIEQDSVDGSTRSEFEEFDSSFKPAWRRYSMPANMTSKSGEGVPVNDRELSYENYYNIALDSKEDILGSGNKYGYEETDPQRRYSRRSSTSSGISRCDSTASESSNGPMRSRQDTNSHKLLKRQLDQSLRHSAMLEAELYRLRDQLAYTNTSWKDQFHTAQHRHQEEVFHAQRQAEAVSNALLEQEFDALKSAMNLMVQEEAKLEDKKKERSCHDESSDKEEYNVKQLLSELKEWKSRHAQVTANSKLVQDILEQENSDLTILLKENQRRISHLEEELEVAVLGDQEGGEADDEESKPISPRLVALLKNHQYELEERVDELLMENANLQQGQSESYALQGQVKELKEALKESNNQLVQHQTWHTRQVEHFRQEAAKAQRKAKSLQESLSHQVTSRETIRGEYVHRIEAVETENVRLKELLDRKQDEWEHRVSLKDRTIESLRSKLSELGQGNLSLRVADTLQSSRGQHRDEKDLLFQIDCLTASETKAKEELAHVQERLKRLMARGVPSCEPQHNELGDKLCRPELDEVTFLDHSTLDDDASIDELLDEL
jgi:hypothetical protein